MTDLATSIGIVATSFNFQLVFEVLGWAALIGLSLGFLKRIILE